MRPGPAALLIVTRRGTALARTTARTTGAAAGVVNTSLASAAKRITCAFSSKPVSCGFTFTIITARPPAAAAEGPAK